MVDYPVVIHQGAFLSGEIPEIKFGGLEKLLSHKCSGPWIKTLAWLRNRMIEWVLQ